jgi:hypothetical protein
MCRSTSLNIASTPCQRLGTAEMPKDMLQLSFDHLTISGVSRNVEEEEKLRDFLIKTFGMHQLSSDTVTSSQVDSSNSSVIADRVIIQNTFYLPNGDDREKKFELEFNWLLNRCNHDVSFAWRVIATACDQAQIHMSCLHRTLSEGNLDRMFFHLVRIEACRNGLIIHNLLFAIFIGV